MYIIADSVRIMYKHPVAHAGAGYRDARSGCGDARSGRGNPRPGCGNCGPGRPARTAPEG